MSINVGKYRFWQHWVRYLDNSGYQVKQTHESACGWKLNRGVRWIDVTMQKCRGVWNKGWQATNFKRWWEAQHRIADSIGKAQQQVCEEGEVRRKWDGSETEVRRKTNEDKIKYSVWMCLMCLGLFLVLFLILFLLGVWSKGDGQQLWVFPPHHVHSESQKIPKDC